MAFSKYFKLKNEDNLWDAIASKKTFLDAFPTRAVLRTNGYCNLPGEIDAYDPDYHDMDLRLLHKIAEEIFPTLQYYGNDFFVSRHLDTELQLCSWYNVLMRPITRAESLSEELLEKMSGQMDFIRCDVTSQLADLGQALDVGSNALPSGALLQRLARMRENMDPKPYFRLGTVLTSQNFSSFPDFFCRAHEELGVDDVEILGFHLDDAAFEDDCRQLRELNGLLKQVCRMAIAKKYKLRTQALQLQVPGVDSSYYRKISVNLQCLQKPLGFIQPRDLEKMSYVVRNPRNSKDYGHSGYVFSNDMKRRDYCEEAFTTPYIMPNGNVEVCGNCNTVLLGNLKQLNFSEIWNNYIYHDVRRNMFEEHIKSSWYPCCNICCRIGASTTCNKAYNSENAYRVMDIIEHGEHHLPVEETRGNVSWPNDYDLEKFCKRVEEVKPYKVVSLKKNVTYLSDLDPMDSSIITRGFGTDKMDTFTPILLSGVRYIKGLYTEAYCLLSYQAPDNAKSFSAVIGLYDAENPNRHINGDYPGLQGKVRLKVLVNGSEVFASECMGARTPGQSITIPLEPGDGITLISELWTPKKPDAGWAVWADAHFCC